MSTKEIKYTERELQLLGMAMRHAKAKPEIDYDALAIEGKFKDGRSARVCFQAVWKKICESGAGATPRKRKNDAGADADGDTPTKKKATPRKSKKEGTPVKAEPGVEDGDNEGVAAAAGGDDF